jgi:uncharacterized membrane protein YvlD (DUF360 family)
MNSKTLRTSKQMIVQAILSAVGLYVLAQVFDGLVVDDLVASLIAVVSIQIAQLLLQDVFRLVAKWFGVIGMLLSSLFGTALVVWVVFSVLPGIEVSGFWNSVGVVWLYSLLLTIINWAFISYSDIAFIDAVKRGVAEKDIRPSKKTGFVFVQLDGVSADLLRWQLQAGNLPNFQKLIEEHGYTFDTWYTQLPSTTPATQAGLLLGANDNIPAFRWYEKDTDRLIVANQFEGAALIEKRLSTGRGLLVDGGVSVSNLFSGDAKTNVMVMSKIARGRQSIKSMNQYSSYFTGSFLFTRSIILTFGEMAKELYQAKRQKSKDVRPRIERHGSYVVLRAATNVFLRNLQNAIVIKHMVEGVNSLYVNYLDYDEIAHHAGPARPEAMAALQGLDSVAGIIMRAKELAARPYEIVFVSDHGQCLGRTFKQLNGGKSLSDELQRLLKDTVASQTSPVEGNTALRSLEDAQGRALARAIKHGSELVSEEEGDGHADGSENVVVTGSGNLGNIWLKRYDGRADKADIERDYPELVRQLLAIEGIGMVIMKSADDYECITRQGTVWLKSGVVSGNDPLAAYANYSHKDLLRLAQMKVAPDICVISSYNPHTKEVHAFEELVGSHGGLGGPQTDAVLLRPTHLEIPMELTESGSIKDATMLHKVFKHWLAEAGHKAGR